MEEREGPLMMLVLLGPSTTALLSLMLVSVLLLALLVMLASASHESPVSGAERASDGPAGDGVGPGTGEVLDGSAVPDMLAIH